MTMNRFSVFVFLFVNCVLLSSCGPKLQQQDDRREGASVVLVDMEMAPLNDSQAAQIFTDPSYLVLRGAYLGNVGQILDWGDRYVILDRKQNKVYLFDTVGQLIRTVGVQGKGPQEYVEVAGIGLLDDELVLAALQPEKLLFFDKEGTFLHKQESSFLYNKGIACSHGCLYGVISANRGESGYTLTKIGRNDDNVSYLPYEKWPAAISGGTYLQVADSGVVWISRPFDNYVYRIDSLHTAPQAYYRLDFGSNDFPKEYADEENDFELIRKIQENNKVFHAARFCEVGDYFVFNTMTSYWLFDRNDCVVRRFATIPATGGLHVEPWGYLPLEYQKQRIVMQIDPLYEEEQIEQGNLQRVPVLDSLLCVNAEYQNPILVFYRVAENK